MTALSRAGKVGPSADVAQLVEHHLAKVRVAGSSPVVRSRSSGGGVAGRTSARWNGACWAVRIEEGVSDDWLDRWCEVAASDRDYGAGFTSRFHPPARFASQLSVSSPARVAMASICSM